MELECPVGKEDAVHHGDLKNIPSKILDNMPPVDADLIICWVSSNPNLYEGNKLLYNYCLSSCQPLICLPLIIPFWCLFFPYALKYTRNAITYPGDYYIVLTETDLWLIEKTCIKIELDKVELYLKKDMDVRDYQCLKPKADSLPSLLYIEFKQGKELVRLGQMVIAEPDAVELLKQTNKYIGIVVEKKTIQKQKEQEIIAINMKSQFKSQLTPHIMKLHTPKQYAYQPFGKYLDFERDENCIVFEIKAQCNAYISLSNTLLPLHFDFEIILDRIDKKTRTVSSIICRRNKGPVLASYNKPVLNAHEFKLFWISWCHGELVLGMGDIVGKYRLMSIAIDTDYHASIVMVCTSSCHGDWSLHPFRYIKREKASNHVLIETDEVDSSADDISNDEAQVKDVYDTFENQIVSSRKCLLYHEFAMHSHEESMIKLLQYMRRKESSFVFELKSKNECFVLLNTVIRHDIDTKVHSNKINRSRYEVLLGGWDDTRSVMYKIDQHNRLSNTSEYHDRVFHPLETKHFWISWFHGELVLGMGDIVGKHRLMSIAIDMDFDVSNILVIGSMV